MELDVAKTMKEELVGIAGCSADNMMKGQVKKPRYWPKWRRVVPKEAKFSCGPRN